ncbi:MAG TPA: DNA-processing protein DprA [Pirellulales bacterium]
MQLLCTRGVGARTLGRILDDCSKRGMRPAEIVGLPDDELAARFRLSPDLPSALAASTDTARQLWKELTEHTVHVLVRGWPGYPTNLRAARGDDAPPVLFALGNLDLLQRPSVGFCGSRRASERGLTIASDCARFLSKNAVNVVSGYAHGIDLAAHRGALEANGSTTVVLAEGILHFRIKSDIKGFANESNLLVISEFPPRLPWAGRQAMARNRTICGLSNALILVESGAEGGTFECGKAALDQRCPLFVVEYAQPPVSAEGNAFFLRRGARALRRSRSGQASMEAVVAAAAMPSGDNGGGQRGELPFEH